MLVAMISLAGVPFTAGFLGKFFIFDAAIQQHQICCSRRRRDYGGCGFYYYLKVVRAMYWEEPTGANAIPISGLSRTAMTLLLIANIVLGVYPQPI